MGFQCSMYKVPRIQTYEQALAHYESVDRWFSTGSKPIKGQLRYDNMRMSKVPWRDGDAIIFRLYSTDCVTYYADGTIAIEGYGSMSTNAFIGQLAPGEITHQMGEGRDDPYLILRRRGSEHWWERDEDGRWVRNTDALVVRCSLPIKLHYCADERRWLPTDEAHLEPFYWTEIDRAKARKASAHYHLADFLKVVPALHALGTVEREIPADINCALDRLANRDFTGALAFCPVGQRARSSIETPICWRFVEQMRNWIYDEFEALSAVEKRVLTLEEYGVYRSRKKRFE